MIAAAGNASDRRNPEAATRKPTAIQFLALGLCGFLLWFVSCGSIQPAENVLVLLLGLFGLFGGIVFTIAAAIRFVAALLGLPRGRSGVKPGFDQGQTGVRPGADPRRHTSESTINNDGQKR